jgi:D-alanyl-lipoteichoic acid acyltransferase DltB (MBOAT superfamily)
VLGCVCGLEVTGINTMTGWSELATPAAPFWVVVALFAITWLLVRELRADLRRYALLAGSCACALAFDPVFAVVSVAWALGFHAALFGGGRARPGRGLAYAIGSFLALGVACSRDLWPGFLDDHRELGRIGYLFALAFTLRIAWLWHEVRMRKQVLSRTDVVLYFVFAPMWVVIPYMLAVVRSDRFRAALPVHDRAVERGGIRMIAWGCVLAVIAWAMHELHDPTDALNAALRAHDLPGVVLWSLLSYPVQHAVKVCAVAAILVGMIRMMGIDLVPSFSRPLAAQTVPDLWRRWNVHFRDLLVELFYVPVAFRLRRKPARAIVMGCFYVFVVGSTLFHIPKYYFRFGSFDPPQINLLAENLVMGAIVAIALLRERGRPATTVTPSPLRVALRVLRTWVIWIVVVLYIGHGLQYAAFGEQVPHAIQPWR